MERRPDRDRATSGRPRVGLPDARLSGPPTARSIAPPLLLCIVALVVASPAHSARQLDLDLDELLYRSALIFEGMATAVDIDAGGGKAARTRIHFTVDRVLRGDFDRRSLAFEVPEGLLPDGRLVETAETPRFKAGERYVVFVRGGPWRLSPVLDWQQGVLRLATIGGHQVAVTDSGRCVAAVERTRMRMGPRVAHRLQWPGFPTTTGADPPDAGAAGRCASASLVISRLDARLGELGLRGPAVERLHLLPRDDVGYTPTSPPASHGAR